MLISDYCTARNSTSDDTGIDLTSVDEYVKVRGGGIHVHVYTVNMYMCNYITLGERLCSPKHNG